MSTEIPNIVIGRLPIYLRELARLKDEEGKVTTSSQELGERLGISSAQIRKDLSHFGEFGKQGTGYHIKYLIGQLRVILHLEVEWPIVLVGAGYLGHAIANYNGFQYRGFRIALIFDTDPLKIGQEMNGVPVQDVVTLEDTVQRQGIEMAILTVPAHAAQEITDCLVRSGVRSILSYAPIHLVAPAGIYVTYSDPVIQLQHMAYYLSPHVSLPK